MKKHLFFISIFIFFTSPGFAQQSFFDFLTPKKEHHQGSLQCPYCHHMNAPGANYCSHCGRELLSHSPQRSQSITCPYCHKQFQCNTTNTMAICQHCNAENPSDGIYCTNCGRQIITETFLVTCPYCWKNFTARLSRSSSPSIYCHRCRKWYSSSERSCPYCSKSPTTITTSPPVSGSLVNIGTFIKTDNKKDVKRYSIGHLTSQRAFSKVVVDVHVTQQQAVNINTIKVSVSGKWIPFTIAYRLQEGRNVFNVSIPQGSPEMVISFESGQGSEVKVYLE